jgi:hypothetical protein
MVENIKVISKMVYKMGRVNIAIEMGNGLKEYGKMEN